VLGLDRNRCSVSVGMGSKTAHKPTAWPDHERQSLRRCLRSSTVLDVAEAVPEEILASGIPVQVRARLLAAPLEWDAEVRSVTVLHTRLADIEEIAPEALEQLHQSVQAVQEIALRLECGLWLRIDDKGIVLLMVFGLPGMAHDNDAERAILAAKALQKALIAPGIGAGIGIATGQAFCGVFGNEVRREYTLHGDVINLAAALMQATAREILCHHTTAELVRGRYTFEACRPSRSRGRSSRFRCIDRRGEWTAAISTIRLSSAAKRSG
jgi:class 3 adenylate cyclase